MRRSPSPQKAQEGERPPTLFFEEMDAKARHLARAALAAGFRAQSLRYKAFFVLPDTVGRQRMRRGDLLLVRYLNDHPDLWKTLVMVCGDLLTAVVVKVLGLRPVWLCHNVDKETERHWGFASTFRRWLWRRLSWRILIPDPSLMACANAIFVRERHKLWPINFAPTPTGPDSGDTAQIAELREFLNGDGDRVGDDAAKLRILVSGLAGEKYLHYALLPRLAESLKEAGYEPRIAVIAPLGDRRGARKTDYSSLIRWCRASPDVHLIDGWIDYSEEEIADSVDLIWRAMGDYSFPFTLFNAAQAQIPILTYEAGHLGSMVERWGIGGCIAHDFSNVPEAIRRARNVSETDWDAFLAPRTWTETTKALRRLREDAS